MNVTQGEKLTVFLINGMAFTSKDEITVVEVKEEKILFKIGRKRALYSMKLPFKNDVLIFKGHKLPIKTDFEHFGNIFHGNACYNIGGLSKTELREFIDTKNINSNFSEHGRVLCMTDDPERPELVYPEVECHSAVIADMKRKLEDA